MAVTKMFFKAWSVAVSAAASECVNATLNAPYLPAVPDTSGTAVDSKGNVWFTSIDLPDTPIDEPEVVIWMCPEDGECVSKPTGENSTQYVTRELAVHASDAVSIVYLLLPQLTGPAHVKKCVWDNNNLEQDIHCSPFVESWTDSSYDYHLALDQGGNVFLSHVTYAREDTYYKLRKCSPSGNCIDFGNGFWDSHRFAPGYVAFDSQDNLYVTRKPRGSSLGFPAGETMVFKCTSAGDCAETQITGPPAPSSGNFLYQEIAVSSNDYIYVMVHDGVYQWLTQCSPDSVCNQGVVTFDYRLTMTGLSADKNGGLYMEVRTFHPDPHPSKVIRLCVPPQINEIQA